jgi:DNA-binding MarR family transcriptional regulator
MRTLKAMKLQEELGLRMGFKLSAHEAILNIYYTGERVKKRARKFFSQYGITDVQFNVLRLLYNQTGKEYSLTQAELSKMMLVNRSNVTSLIDRMEKAGLVRRNDVPGDRRYNAIQLTSQGGKILLEVEDKYLKEVTKIMSELTGKETRELIQLLERIRANL